jgi:hypothetical protein
MISMHDEAIFIRDETLRAIQILHSLVGKSETWDEQFQTDLSKGIGITIGTADTRILCKIYEYFPELNDLKEDTV